MSQPDKETQGPSEERPALTSAPPEEKPTAEAGPAPQPSKPQPDRQPQGWFSPALVVGLVALAAALGLYWHTQERMREVELELARRIGEFDTSSRDAKTAAQDASVLLGDLSTRLTALENRAQESQSEQLALASMYQELARGQDERVLDEIDQTLLLAQQQLKLAGNVRAAIIGLEAAEARLKRLSKPQFTALQQAIAADIGRLKLLPTADLSGLGARLDVLVQNVDRLKLEAETETPPVEASAPVVAESGTGSFSQMWQRWWEEIRQLVRVRRLDKPEVPLLAPSQDWFLRENLKLRLLAARLAILSRDEATYRADLAAAKEWVARYFSPHDPLTQPMLDGLEELRAQPIRLEEADIGESLKVLRGKAGGKGE